MQTKSGGHEARKWRIVDATGIPVGRLASEVAALIRGKHKVEFTPHIDGGDFVVVVNADKVAFTGNKAETKTYWHHTGFFGGIKGIKAGDLLAQNPVKVIELAVKGMLPKGPLGRAVGTKLKVYSGPNHPHAAQQPVEYKVKGLAKKAA
jgi:large subunit ribosomal protein L13